jgi:hypothetical protein
LIGAEIVSLGVDITLLRFNPAAQESWEHLKVNSTAELTYGKALVAWGFPLDQDLFSAPLSVAGLMGPENTVPVGAGLLKGMSGGPVLDEAGNVVGVVTAGARGEPALNYFTPITFANPLIRDLATYVNDQPKPQPNKPGVVARTPIAKNYEIFESKSIGALKSKSYTITRDADRGRTINRDTARFVATNNSGTSNVSLSVAEDGKSVTLKYEVSGGQPGTLTGNIFTEQQ